MSYNVEVTSFFEKDLKKLAKKHPSIKADLTTLISELETNPTKGTSLGLNCYKIRMAISSKGRGKSGGARIITHVYVDEGNVYLLAIYDKSQKETISDKELKELLFLLDLN